MASPDTHVGAIQALAELCRELDQLDLEVGSSGNASIRLHDKISITGSGYTFAMSTDPANLSLVALRSARAITGPRASSDVESHRQIYAARPDVACIIHTHAHFITLAALIGQAIPPICTMHADYFGSDIRVVPYSNHRTHGFGAQHNFLEGSAFLLQNHGGLLLLSADAIRHGRQTLSGFEEVCHLYCDLVGTHPRAQWSAVPRDDATVLHAYYARSYGSR